VRVDRSGWALLAFAAYAGVSLVMLNSPSRPLLPPPLGGRVQLGDLLFPLGLGVWAWAGLPGLAVAARLAGIPVAAWVGAAAIAAAASPWPGPAWRETAAFAYLGLVLVWGTAVLAKSPAAGLRAFLRWWLLAIAILVVLGLVGWGVAVVTGTGNYLVEVRHGMRFLGTTFRVRSTLLPTSRLIATLLILALPALFALRRHGAPAERRLCAWLVPVLAACALLTYARQALEFLGLLGLLLLLERGGRRALLAAGLAVAYVAGFAAIELVSVWHVTAAEVTRAADRSREVTDAQYYWTMPDVGVQTLTVRLEYVHDTRAVLRRIAWRAFRERPLAGWGPDAWPRVQDRAKAAGHAPEGFRWASAHGEPFSVAAEMGLVGLAGFAAFWALGLRAMARARGAGLAADVARLHALAGAAIVLTSVNLDLMRFRFLWVSLALGLAAAAAAREEGPT
jgi:hypothetical protein